MVRNSWLGVGLLSMPAPTYHTGKITYTTFYPKFKTSYVISLCFQAEITI